MSELKCPEGTRPGTHTYRIKNFGSGIDSCNNGYKTLNIFKNGNKVIEYRICTSDQPVCVLGDVENFLAIEEA